MDNVDSVPFYTIERYKQNEADTHLANIIIRPNPTADNLLVQLRQNPKGSRYDLLRKDDNRAICSVKWLGLSVRIPFNQCPRGTYWLNITDLATGQQCMYIITKSYKAVARRENPTIR